MPDLEEDLRVPHRRAWIYILVGVIALVCAGVVAYMMLRGEEDKAPKKIPAPKRLAPPAKPVSSPTQPPAPKVKQLRAPAKPAPARPAASPPIAPSTSVVVQAPLTARSDDRQVEKVKASAIRRNIDEGPRGLGHLRKLSLQKIDGYGSLKIITGDPRAKVYVNGKYRGQGAEVALEKEISGSKRVEVEIGGKRLPLRSITLEKDGQQNVEF